MLRKSKVNLLVFLIWTGFAAVPLGIGVKGLVGAYTASSWPQASAKLLDYQIEKGAGSKNPSLYLKLAYEFTVDGQAFTGTAIAPTDPAFGSYAEAREWIKEKVDDQQNLMVYYRSGNPADSYVVLNPWPNLLPLVIGMAFMGIGIVCLFIPIKTIKTVDAPKASAWCL